MIDTEAFVPDKTQGRQDGGLELSINWEDDDRAIHLVTKNVAQFGFARVYKDVLEGTPLVDNVISWERQALADNPYHGNIVFSPSVPKFRQKQVASYLAVHAIFVPRPGG